MDLHACIESRVNGLNSESPVSHDDIARQQICQDTGLLHYVFVRHSPSPTGRNDCDAALWRDANQVLHCLVVLVVRVHV